MTRTGASDISFHLTRNLEQLCKLSASAEAAQCQLLQLILTSPSCEPMELTGVQGGSAVSKSSNSQSSSPLWAEAGTGWVAAAQSPTAPSAREISNAAKSSLITTLSKPPKSSLSLVSWATCLLLWQLDSVQTAPATTVHSVSPDFTSVSSLPLDSSAAPDTAGSWVPQSVTLTSDSVSLLCLTLLSQTVLLMVAILSGEVSAASETHQNNHQN
jgi:hypothetical protein